MKKQATICLILCGLFLLIGCGTIPNDDLPDTSLAPIPDGIVTGTGITDAFLENDEIYTLFEIVAHNSLSLDPGDCHYDCDTESYHYYSGGGDLLKTIRVNEETAEAVRKLMEYYPGIDIWMSYMNTMGLDAVDDEAMGIFFYTNRIDTEKSEDIFIEELLYTLAEFDYVKHGYEDIGGNWYSRTYFMPVYFGP